MTRFAEMPLRFADAAVVVCAERNGGVVLTFDRAALDVVAREVPVSVLSVRSADSARYTGSLDGRRVTERGMRPLRRMGAR